MGWIGREEEAGAFTFFSFDSCASKSFCNISQITQISRLETLWTQLTQDSGFFLFYHISEKWPQGYLNNLSVWLIYAYTKVLCSVIILALYEAKISSWNFSPTGLKLLWKVFSGISTVHILLSAFNIPTHTPNYVSSPDLSSELQKPISKAYLIVSIIWGFQMDSHTSSVSKSFFQFQWTAPSCICPHGKSSLTPSPSFLHLHLVYHTKSAPLIHSSPTMYLKSTELSPSLPWYHPTEQLWLPNCLLLSLQFTS